jgi:hypothetical protein
MPIFNPISPFSVVGLARSVLARIKSLQQQEKGPNEPKRRHENKSAGEKISYVSQGRSGKVVYKSPETTFALYYEFGGGDVVVCINVPSPEEWQAHTGLPPEQRDAVLHYIGQQVVLDHTAGGSYKIEGNWMNIYA